MSVIKLYMELISLDLPEPAPPWTITKGGEGLERWRGPEGWIWCSWFWMECWRGWILEFEFLDGVLERVDLELVLLDGWLERVDLELLFSGGMVLTPPLPLKKNR